MKGFDLKELGMKGVVRGSAQTTLKRDFLWSKEKRRCKISTLSGGEKKRFGGGEKMDRERGTLLITVKKGSTICHRRRSNHPPKRREGF